MQAFFFWHVCRLIVIPAYRMYCMIFTILHDTSHDLYCIIIIVIYLFIFFFLTYKNLSSLSPAFFLYKAIIPRYLSLSPRPRPLFSIAFLFFFPTPDARIPLPSPPPPQLPEPEQLIELELIITINFNASL